MSLRILVFNLDINNYVVLKNLFSGNNNEIQVVNHQNDLLKKLEEYKPDILFYKLESNRETNLINLKRTHRSLKIIVLAEQILKEQVLSLMKNEITDIFLFPLDEKIIYPKLQTIFLEITKVKKIEAPQKSELNSGVQDFEPVLSDKQKCLLVDTDKNFKNNFRSAFNNKYEIITADNGEEALNIYFHQRPELVLLSENLKIINEHTLSQKIKSIDNTGKTKIYYISSILKTSSKSTSIFTGILSRNIDFDKFYKDFQRIVWAEQDLLAKISNLTKEYLPDEFEKIIETSFSEIVRKNITFIRKKDNISVKNDILFIRELTDFKKEISVTTGFWASDKDMLALVEYISGELIPFNNKAAEIVDKLGQKITEKINLFFLNKNVNVSPNLNKVLGRNENKLNYEWDIEIKFKTDKNELFACGLYSCKYI